MEIKRLSQTVSTEGAEVSGVLLKFAAVAEWFVFQNIPIITVIKWFVCENIQTIIVVEWFVFEKFQLLLARVSDWWEC